MLSGSNYYNYLQTGVAPSIYQKWLNDPEIRRLMHTGDKAYHNGTLVEKYLLGDFLIPVTGWIKASFMARERVYLVQYVA